MSLVPGERDHVAKKRSSEQGDLLHLYQIEFSQVKQRNVVRQSYSHCDWTWICPEPWRHPACQCTFSRRSHVHAEVQLLAALPLSLYPLWSDCHRYASSPHHCSLCLSLLLFLSGGNESYETKKETETSGAETGAATATQI